MSVFYVLPPRQVLGDSLAHFLQPILPGLDWDSRTRRDLAELVGAAAGAHREVYIVYREELPTGETMEQALANGFGAESGDEVIEVRLGDSRPRVQRPSLARRLSGFCRLRLSRPLGDSLAKERPRNNFPRSELFFLPSPLYSGERGRG